MKFKFNPSNKTFANGYRLIGEKIFDMMKLSSKPYQIPESAVREGTYAIRIQDKYEYYEYYKPKNWWILRTVETHNFYQLYEWNLIPQLSDKEYQKLQSIFKYLSKEWQQNVSAWSFSKEIKQITLSARIIKMKVKRERIKK